MAARSSLKRFWRNDSGATAIEYGLIVALIFLAIITGVTAFGDKSNQTYKVIGDKIDEVLKD